MPESTMTEFTANVLNTDMLNQIVSYCDDVGLHVELTSEELKAYADAAGGLTAILAMQSK